MAAKPADTPELLNYRQVMERLSCSESAVRTLAKRGLIERKYFPAIGYRYLPQSVERYIKEQGIRG